MSARPDAGRAIRMRTLIDEFTPECVAARGCDRELALFLGTNFPGRSLRLQGNNYCTVTVSLVGGATVLPALELPTWATKLVTLSPGSA